jgi:hypothetical protein
MKYCFIFLLLYENTLFVLEASVIFLSWGWGWVWFIILFEWECVIRVLQRTICYHFTCPQKYIYMIKRICARDMLCTARKAEQKESHNQDGNRIHIFQ